MHFCSLNFSSQNLTIFSRSIIAPCLLVTTAIILPIGLFYKLSFTRHIHKFIIPYYTAFLLEIISPIEHNIHAFQCYATCGDQLLPFRVAESDQFSQETRALLILLTLRILKQSLWSSTNQPKNSYFNLNFILINITKLFLLNVAIC